VTYVSIAEEDGFRLSIKFEIYDTVYLSFVILLKLSFIRSSLLEEYIFLG